MARDMSLVRVGYSLLFKFGKNDVMGNERGSSGRIVGDPELMPKVPVNAQTLHVSTGTNLSDFPTNQDFEHNPP